LTDPHALRRAYREEVASFLKEIEKACRMADIDYVPLRTNQNLGIAISSYLASRSARIR
jgi:hypothetical protein